MTADGQPDVKSDFFVSYTRSDERWAEWIAWVLEDAGYRVLIQAWDFVPGSNWMQGMEAGIRDATRTIAVLSRSYLRSAYGNIEWQAVLASDPTGRRLLVARIEECQRPMLLAAVVSVDLFDTPEITAQAVLLAMAEKARKGRAKPTARPIFPGKARPDFPGNDRDHTAGPAIPVGGNWFQRQSPKKRVATVTAALAFIILAAIGAKAAGIFTLLTQSNSPSSTKPTTTPSTSPTHEPIAKVAKNLVILPSLGVDTVAYSFDGKRLATGDAKGVVRLWSTSDWKASSMTYPGSGEVNSVAFNRTNSLLAAGDADGHVYVWEKDHARVLTDPSGSPIRSVAFSPDSKYLAAGDASGSVTIWRTSTWRPGHPMADADSSGITSVTFNPANSLLAAGDSNGHIYLWVKGKATTLKDPVGSSVQSVVFSADDLALVSGNSAGYFEVWHESGGRRWVKKLSPSHYKVIEKHRDPDTNGIKSVAFNARTRIIAAADGNGQVYLWLFKNLHRFQYPANNSALSVSYSPDDSHLAVASADGNVYVKPTQSS